MRRKIKNLYRTMQLDRAYWMKERDSRMEVEVLTKVKMWRKGFLGESYYVYNLDSKESSFYLTDKQQMKTYYINGNYSIVLNNKIIFEQLYNKLLNIPETLAVIHNGNIISKSKKVSNFDSLIKYIESEGKVVIKPISGSGGYGVKIISFEKGEFYSNDQSIALENLAKDLSELNGYYISEFIHQSDFAFKLNPYTLNSMRIVTAIDPHTNEAFIPIAVQRIGTHKSAPADNWTQGGISAEIDVNTGTMKKGASYPIDGNLNWHAKHPDTGAQIEGLNIPRWEEIKGMIITTANAHPYIKYIGWDVVSTDDGIMVIEANNCTDVNLLQIHRPLLKDKRLKRFYEYYNVI